MAGGVELQVAEDPTGNEDYEKAKHHMVLAGKLEALARDEKNETTERLSAALKALSYVGRYHAALLRVPGLNPQNAAQGIVNQLVRERLVQAAGPSGILKLRQQKIDRVSAMVLLTWTFGIGLVLEGWARIAHYGFLIVVVAVSTWLGIKAVRKAKTSV